MNRWLKVLAVVALVAAPLSAQSARRPLAAADIDDIATLLKLEDTRNFDEAALGRIGKSAHPEVRRRAVTSMGRIVNEKARAMLAALRDDKDPTVLPIVAWATGQQKDAGAIPWLGRDATKSIPACFSPGRTWLTDSALTTHSSAAFGTREPWSQTRGRRVGPRSKGAVRR